MFFTAVLGSVSLDAVPGPVVDDVAMAFSLRFIGDISGRFGLHLQQTAARNLAANFLGEADTDISPIAVSEVIGELANMLCGSVMSRVEGERSFALSHPVAGSMTPPHDCDSLVISTLETEVGAITIWIAIEGSPCLS
jgi:CheY-specific phosphatase CheX